MPTPVIVLTVLAVSAVAAAMILEEPCSALDPAGRREVLDLIGRLARTATVVLSTHGLADVQQVTDLLAYSASVFALQVRPPAAGLVDALRDRPWVTEAVERVPSRIRAPENAHASLA